MSSRKTLSLEHPATIKLKSPIPYLKILENQGKLHSQNVLETLIPLLYKALCSNIDSNNTPKTFHHTACKNIIEGVSFSFTHNARAGTQNSSLPVYTAQIRTTTRHHPTRPTHDGWSFTAAGQIIEDCARNATYDNITRILISPWRCVDLDHPEPPIDSIIDGRPPYGHLCDPNAWTQTQFYHAVEFFAQNRFWQKLKKARNYVPQLPRLDSFVGAPIIHFPIPRERDDIPHPPDYILLCIIPPNAALAEVAQNWPSISPHEISQPLLKELCSILQAEAQKHASQSQSHEEDQKQLRAVSKILKDIQHLTLSFQQLNHSPVEPAAAGSIQHPTLSFQQLNSILKEIRSLASSNISLQKAITPTVKKIIRNYRPRIQWMRLFNSKEATINISGLLANQDLLPMIRIDLPIEGMWLPDLPLNFAPGPERNKILRDYADLLQSRHKANFHYRKRLLKTIQRLIAHSFEPLENALKSGDITPNIPGTIPELAALLHTTEPNETQQRAVVQAFVRDILKDLSLIDQHAIGNDAQIIADDLESQTQRYLQSLLSNQEHQSS